MIGRPSHLLFKTSSRVPTLSDSWSPSATPAPRPPCITSPASRWAEPARTRSSGCLGRRLTKAPGPTPPAPQGHAKVGLGGRVVAHFPSRGIEFQHKAIGHCRPTPSLPTRRGTGRTPTTSTGQHHRQHQRLERLQALPCASDLKVRLGTKKGVQRGSKGAKTGQIG